MKVIAGVIVRPAIMVPSMPVKMVVATSGGRMAPERARNVGSAAPAMGDPTVPNSMGTVPGGIRAPRRPAYSPRLRK